MRISILLLCTAALAAQTRDIPFGGNVLHADKKAELASADHRVELRRGTVVYQVANSAAPPVEIVTPCVTIHPYFLGDYKIEVKKSGETTITPLGGDVKVSSVQGAEWVTVGKKMIVRGAMANPEFKIVSAKSGWAWVRESLVLLAHNMSISGGGGSSSDDSTPAQSQDGGSKPAAAAAPTQTTKAPDSFSHGDTRVATSPARGK